MEQQQEIFDVRMVPLQGTNLVEASAGTGKTYSIAILVLRLIVEQKISITHQLIVTFTRFAVAELQERIRYFIKMAYDASCGVSIPDGLIAELVQQAPQDGLKDRLRAELLMMDEANILTIHGFSQQILNEFAFETKQHFDASLQSDLSEVIRMAVNRFWRAVMTNLPVHTFSLKEMQDFKEQLPILIQKHLGGQQYAGWSAEVLYDDFTPYLDIADVHRSLEIKRQQLQQLLVDDFSATAQSVAANGYARKSLEPLLADPVSFIDAALATARKGTAYIQKLEGHFWDALREVVLEEEELSARRAGFKVFLSCHVVQHYAVQVTEYVQQNGILTFDAMIQDLHRIVVTEGNEYLVQLIRNRYPAVFIDEFQDTDATQFALFERLFIDHASDTVLFLIGDPKQSIYAFRSADVESYLSAREKVAKVYSMNVNYRSTATMVQSVNAFFGALGTSAFGYTAEDRSKILYLPVESKDQHKAIWSNGTPEQDTLVLSGYDKTGTAREAIAREIARLLDPANRCMIGDPQQEDGMRPVQPSDIGVLVRSSRDGAEIKKILRDYNILAVPIDDTRILRTTEAKDIVLLLKAMIEPTASNIATALYLSFMNTLFYEEQGRLLQRGYIDEVAMIGLFREYHQLVMDQKIYQAFQKLFADFSIPQKMSRNTRSLRSLTNLLQLTQLLHQQQYRRNMQAEDMLIWLQHPDAASATGDAYEVQLESDENAVSIVTIHKSKGLEYNIVFVYGIHSKEGLRAGYNQFKDEDGHIRFAEKEQLTALQEQRLLKQAEQEQRRLIYVALTRAVYKCYIYYAKTGFKDSGLAKFVAQIETGQGILPDYLSPDEVCTYTAPHDQLSLTPVSFNEQQLLRSRSPWSMVSYSALNVKHEYISKTHSQELSGYDHFVFNELPRGADAGTQLHEMLEQLDFTRDYSTLEQLNRYELMLLSVFNVRSKDEIKIDRTDWMRQLVEHIVQAEISIEDKSFHLASVPNRHKLNELEFNFPVHSATIQGRLIPLLESFGATMNDKYFSLQGMMNGKIDLLLAHGQQYYVLDWKSNYLGCAVEDYEGGLLYDAMTEHNYHLQYLIYTVAVHKYLRQRMGEAYDYNRHFGGVVYVFFRGVRAGKRSGVFTVKPPLELIEQLTALLYFS